MNSKTAILLVGGHSTRMGTDKFAMDNGGQPQWKFMVEELEALFDEVQIACRADQAAHFEGHKLVLDQHENIGPMGALCSSFRSRILRDCSLRSEKNLMNESLFFVACDLPGFDVSLAKKLHAENLNAYDVVAAKHPDKTRPEPLVAFWNRSALPRIEACIAKEDYALFRCMSQLRVKAVEVEDGKVLHNVNRPSDL